MVDTAKLIHIADCVLDGQDEVIVRDAVDELVRLRAALIVAFNRMPTYTFDIEDLKNDRRLVQSALGIGDAVCIVVEQSTREKT